MAGARSSSRSFPRVAPAPWRPPVQTGSAFAPVWRGNELFILTERAMLVADVRTTPALEVGAPRVLFENRVFVCCNVWFPLDASPEGDWMVWISPQLDGVPRIRMVTGWLDAARSRIGR